MSGARTSPRFDVVASTRRSWSQEQKQAIVAEVEVPGASLSAVARRHGVHASLLFRWRRDLRAKAGAPANGADARRPASKSPGTPPATVQHFVPIMLPPPEAPAAAKPRTIEIVIKGGRTVRVGADVDTAALIRIIAALETGR